MMVGILFGLFINLKNFKEIFPIRLASRQAYGEYSWLMIYVGGLTVGSAILGQLILGAVRKQPEQAMRNKPVNNVPPCLLLQSFFQVVI